MKSYSGKSIVSMEQAQCPVCGALHDTGSILLQTRGMMNPRLSRNTVTGFELCPEHKKLADEGYIALIELKNQPENKASLQDSWPLRTGNLAHIRRTAFAQVFNVSAPEGPLCFIDVGVLEKLKALTADSAGEAS